MCNKFYSFTNLRPTLKLLNYILCEGKLKKYNHVFHSIIGLLYENFLFNLNKDSLLLNYKFYMELRTYLNTNHKFYNLNILIN